MIKQNRPEDFIPILVIIFVSLLILGIVSALVYLKQGDNNVHGKRSIETTQDGRRLQGDTLLGHDEQSHNWVWLEHRVEKVIEDGTYPIISREAISA